MDCVALINEENMISGADDKYVSKLPFSGDKIRQHFVLLQIVFVCC